MVLENKVAVITGAARGIGRAIAEEMLKQGARVVINDVDEDELNKTRDELGGEDRIAAVPGDVSSLEDARRIVGTAVEKFGSLDALVNNAGILRDRTFVKMSEEEWDAVIRVHLRGTFCCSKAAVEIMREKEGGAIVNITSTAGMRGNIGQSNYAAAKAGILGFTRTLSMELQKYGIRVNAVAPGAKTRMTLSIPEEVIRKKAQEDPRYLKLLQLPGPEYVAGLICFLVSDLAKEITGLIFGIVGNELSLWAFPHQVKVMYAPERWDVQLLEKNIPRLIEPLK